MMAALTYAGEGEFHAAGRGLAVLCDKQLVIGETLRWQIVSERSAASHAHYFACVASAWASLPESLAADFPSPEHLRKHALIKAGYCSMNRLAFRTNADAVAACAVLSSMDSYSICDVAGNVVTVYRATSQSMRAMGKKAFQESKDKVLDVISQLIGADATQAGQAA